MRSASIRPFLKRVGAAQWHETTDWKIGRAPERRRALCRGRGHGGGRGPWADRGPAGARLCRAGHRRIREWAAQETAAGRLLPWFAVAYGAGIVVYFTAEREPSLWAAATLAAVCGLAALLLRKRFVAQVVALGVFAASLGFAIATLKTSLIDHPVLRFSASGVTIAGFVELREESQHTDRFVLRVDRLEGGRMDVKPERVPRDWRLRLCARRHQSDRLAKRRGTVAAG